MIPISVTIAEVVGSKAAVQKVVRKVGPARAAKLFVRVMLDAARGEPWKSLGPPADEKEALSRRQIGGAVLLDRRLREILPPEAARKMTARIALLASNEFLKQSIPRLRKQNLLAMSEPRRKCYLKNIQAKFFNADAGLRMKGEEALFLTVSRCRFVELLAAIGEADMAPLFCKGDALFFDERQPDVDLERPETLAEGGACCDFQFRFKNK